MVRRMLRMSLVFSCLVLIRATGAQTPTGYSGGPVTNASFYRIAPGHMDEWPGEERNHVQARHP